ncbi:hypothetical protein [Clostridium chromiireducens]|uniref:Phage-Barnase-EndoU-ColicinE5/D-RelE like nuclease 3 domain-containing protein n=1 Tax=Clostridium chromiireducens TaxID=225345 RepID=A0A1V4I5F3_9CLOT|nr:hypothetical protein [Clostridium chromiireducens]OPJ55201.1 hypothetical protein CLCHR_47060 [Clostridium chromiireducens]
MNHYFEDNLKIFKLEGKLHKKIILYYANYKNHIKVRHPEMTMKKIEEILNEPDFVYKQSRNSSIFYYEKNILNETYRVVIETYKKHIKSVVTAYNVKSKEGFTIKHIYCVYDKNTFIDYEDIQKEFENDMEYFYELFNIAE